MAPASNCSMPYVLDLGRDQNGCWPGSSANVDTVSRTVDQRVQVASVTAESTLTRDTVPVNVEREMLGQELQRILDEKTNPWDITVQSVEIRDVQVPAQLQDAMSREAQAERERRGRGLAPPRHEHALMRPSRRMAPW